MAVEPAPFRVGGECDPWFEQVREVFAEHFARGNEQGASVCVSVDGRVVVDLFAGQASRRDGGVPWKRDTIVNIYSATKGISALCLHVLIDRGLLDLEAPVARYWPEFSQCDKGAITVADVLGHRAGLAALVSPLPHDALYDHDRICACLAGQSPLWPVGHAHGYHAVTFGFLVGELVRRVTGRTLGRFLAEHIAGPLGADVHIGLGAEHDARVAHVTRPLGIAPPVGQPDLLEVFRKEPDSLTARAFGNPAPAQGSVNTRPWRAAEIPGSNGHANARGLCRVYNAALSGEQISASQVGRLQTELSKGVDRVLRVPTRFGAGLMLSQQGGGGWFSPSAGAFGHPGMGGSLGMADPESGLAFGYTMNRAGASILVGERPRRLLKACYACL